MHPGTFQHRRSTIHPGQLIALLNEVFRHWTAVTAADIQHRATAANKSDEFIQPGFFHQITRAQARKGLSVVVINVEDVFGGGVGHFGSGSRVLGDTSENKTPDNFHQTFYKLLPFTGASQFIATKRDNAWGLFCTRRISKAA